MNWAANFGSWLAVSGMVSQVAGRLAANQWTQGKPQTGVASKSIKLRANAWVAVGASVIVIGNERTGTPAKKSVASTCLVKRAGKKPSVRGTVISFSHTLSKVYYTRLIISCRKFLVVSQQRLVPTAVRREQNGALKSGNRLGQGADHQSC